MAGTLDRRLSKLLGQATNPHPGALPRRRSSDHEPRRGWVPALAIALSVAVVDWVVKWWVVQRLPIWGYEVLVEDRVALLHVRNDAMMLGLYADLPLEARKLIAILAAFAGTLLLFEVLSRGHRLPRRQRPFVWLFVGLASGGMLGNLGERAVHWGVTDYLSFRWNDLWLPPGNIADIAIFASVPIAVVVMQFELEARLRRRGREAEPLRPPLLLGPATGGLTETE